MIQAQRQATASPSDEYEPPSPRLETKFHVQFLAGERFMKKLEKAKALLSNRSGSLSYEFVLEAALDEFLKNHDPEERDKRRETRREKAEAGTKPANRAAAKTSGDRSKSGVAAQGEASRRIPAAVRDAVFARDKGRCTYVASNGNRCASTHHLQIDHVIPYARGGTNTLDNLRLLCERHNKKEAERVYGANVTREFRARE
jgi:5-methylcytosine-specific restriction endonuclease McrA